MKKALLFIAISLATFMMVLDYSIANVSIPYIAGSLAVSYEEGTYAITSFAVGSSIGIALTSWLVKRFGEIRTFLVSIALFTFFSWACGASYSLAMFVINRFLQGIVSGPLIPLSNTLIIRLGTEKERTRNLTIWSVIIIVAPVIGPILGGYISDWHEWPWIFYINIPIGAFCFFVIWSQMRAKESPLENVPSDYVGMFLLSLSVTCLQIFLDKGQQWDWFNSNLIIVLFITTIISCIYFIIWELNVPHPLINLRLFQSPTFFLSILGIATAYAIYFGTVVTLPIWLQKYMNYNAEWAGLAVCFLGVPSLMLFYIGPSIIKKIGEVFSLVITFFLFAISSFYTAFVFTTEVNFFHVAFSRFLFGLGLILFIAPLLGLSSKGINEKDLPSSTSLFHFIRALMGGVGTSVFTTIFYRRTIFHHERIGSSFSALNPITPRISAEKPLAIWDSLLEKEASLLAINEVFYLMGILFLALIVIFSASKIYVKNSG